MLSTYASDCLYLLRGRQKHRLSRWGTLTRLLFGIFPTDILGYQVQYLQRRTLFSCFHDIFVRDSYAFSTNHPCPLIIDGGANIGMATLFFKSLYPEAHVWAFEPDLRTFETLQANVAANRLGDVRLFNAALWDADGTIDFYGPADEPGSLMMSADPRRGGKPTAVPARRLSALIDRRVDLLKLDVEGSEMRVLRDLAETGKLSFVAEMVIEYHHHIGNEPSRLSHFLGLLESEGFCYQISASHVPWTAHDLPQDLLIRAYRRCPPGSGNGDSHGN